MSTVPTTKVHELAKVGFSKGNDLYDKARPSYQPEALSFIRKAVGPKSPVNVVEIGAGTGIFTRALLAHPEWSDSVGVLKAVEPSEGMRSVFSKSVVDPRVSVSEGTFDNTSVESGWADLVVIAQAFHWCPDFDAALKEFARVLKPDGVVALIWNLEDRDTARWVAQLREVYEQYEQGSPQFRLSFWRKVFSEPSYPLLFLPPEETTLSRVIPATEESITERVLTKSYIAVQPQQEQESVKQRISDILARGDDKVWIDKENGVFEYPYNTFIAVFRRK